MKELRKHPRYRTHARAKVGGLYEGEALLMDLSVTGCRLEFSAAVAFSLGQKYRLTVLPEDRSAVEPFELLASPLWSRADYDAFDVGFSIEASPKGRAFKRYVEYLDWRAGQADAESPAP